MKYANPNPVHRNAFSAGILFLTILTGLSIVPVMASGLDETRLRTLGEAINRNQDTISSEELAQWVIEDRKDYYLIDVRSEEAFEYAHIQGAINIPVQKLFDPRQVNALPRHQIIVVYSNANMRAAQAATMLRLAGLDAYSLMGGFEYWTLKTLNPELAATKNPNPEQLDPARRAAIARALKNCDMPYPCHSIPTQGYMPPLTPVEETAAPPPPSGGGVLLDGGC